MRLSPHPLDQVVGKFRLYALIGYRWILLGLIATLAACSPSAPQPYSPQEGDIVFQSLPHDPLVDTIEGASQSPYSHCGIVAFQRNQWVVIEAFGTVCETPWQVWIERGRDSRFAVYRLDASFTHQLTDILTRARSFLGRPYDIHYSFDDDAIYCSELVQKAVQGATGRLLGKNQRLGDLNWQPYESVIRSLEGDLPLDRLMITPRSLAEAPELSLVYPPEPLHSD